MFAKFIAQTPPRTSSTTCSNYENDVDYNGNDIGSTQQSSADGCCADCAAKSGCTVYVRTNHNGATCWLKSSKGKMSSKIGAKAGSISPSTTTPTPTSPSTPTQGECSSYGEDVDYYGNDIGSTQRSSADSCCADCAALPGCNLFLKKGRGQKSVKQRCRESTLSNTCGKSESNIDFTGQDVANVPGKSPADCCGACKANNACNAYTLWNNICWLKSGRNSRTNASGTIAGIVNKCSTLEISIDYIGNDIGKADTTYFHGLTGLVILKGAKGNTISKGNVISAVVVM
ncbi:carbohydrate-binding protein [Thraustotheca clavata]|uniref:Carbohydrate-binding protein n=1 Tax=Thraustotheca clavata TaxID=74557 RepID=A0A1V9ZQ59_9STRA|nr:carbohydrate-binding protein [Thraustotheca clavata]